MVGFLVRFALTHGGHMTASDILWLTFNAELCLGLLWWVKR